MAALVTSAQVLAYLEIENEDLGAAVATGMADQIEALLLGDCGRVGRPWSAAQNGRVEVRDGTGRAVLWLDYKLAVLSSVKLGYDPTDPDEELDVADQALLNHRVGSMRLVRVDGNVFGCRGQPNYVQVTYDAAADLPAGGDLVILRALARIWLQRGAEDAASERFGGLSTEQIQAIRSDELWQGFVSNNLAALA